MISLTLLLALLLDRLLGEARRWHPLVGFGALASWMENKLHPGTESKPWKQLLSGLLAVVLLLIPCITITLLIALNSTISTISILPVYALAYLQITVNGCSLNRPYKTTQ